MTDFSTDLTIIIPNFNGANFLVECLQSLVDAIKQTPKSKFEIILVDNNSNDNSPYLAKDFLTPKKLKNLTFRILLLTSNVGFASAVNKGVSLAKYPYVCIYNNDLTVKSDWFKIISQSIQNNKNPKITTFFGTVLNHNGTKFESQGFEYDYSGKCTNISNGKKFLTSNILNLESKSIWGAPAALIVYQKEIFQKIGGYDSTFFAYLEDVDLSFRLNKLGFRTLYLPQAISYHIGGATSQKMGTLRYRLGFRNWFFIILKNYSLSETIKNLYKIFVQRIHDLSAMIKSTFQKYHFASFFFIPYLLTQTILEILFFTPNMLQKHHLIQKMLKSTNKLSTL